MAKKTKTSKRKRIRPKGLPPGGPPPSTPAPEKPKPQKTSAVALAAAGDLNFDTISPEQVRQIKMARRTSPSLVHRNERGMVMRRAGLAAAASATRRIAVAEGDSWFDLPWVYVVTDLLDCLHANHGYEIESFAKRGDTLENMSYGTERDNLHRRKTPSIGQVIDAVRALQPRVFLFSGGGNDFVGDEFASFLNHADSGLPYIRADYVEFMFSTAFRSAIERMIDRVCDAAPGCKVFMHGYGYAIPDGRGSNVIINWAGPWMLPTLTSKGVPVEQQWGTVRSLVDSYNAMLHGISIDPAYRDKFVYVDLRPIVQEDDWVDELHLSSGGYARVAAEVNRLVEQNVGGW